MSFVAVGTKYAKDVTGGKILACKWVKLACERFLKDLKRKDIVFKKDQAERVCKFVERMPHIKGKWAKDGQKIKLEPWQTFQLINVFGWYRKDGTRRFRQVYEEVPRKNAKSTKVAAVALYMFSADGEAGAEVYSAATTRDQAKIVFGVAREMARKEPEYRARFGVEVNAHNLCIVQSASKFEALSAEGSNLDGLNIHFGAVDEVHAHKTRDVYDVLETALGSREQPILWNVTTSGNNRAGICYEIRSYAIKVLEGVVDDDSFFGIIYTIDEGDDWTSPETWKKANPNYGISVNPDDLAAKCKKAMQMPSAQNNFLTKHLNVWVNADTAWMDMLKWEKCADHSLDISQFEGEPCFIGLDLASKIDLASMAKVFVRDDHYYVFISNYLPEETVENSENSQYSGWEKEGRLITTPGNVIDFGYIEEELKDASNKFEIKEVAYDPFQATQLATRMQDEGFTMVEVRPTVLNFSQPMKELEALVIAGRLHFDGDPVLTWAISNVVCHMDAKDNIYPRKERVENKIDPVIALLMALNRALVNNDGGSIYEERSF